MKKILTPVLFTCLLLTAGGAVRFTAAQDSTAQPGQPTQARVWIQNRGSAEAMPVSIQEQAAEAAPLRVQVVGSAAGSSTPRPRWEYQNVTIKTGQDPTGQLNAAGAEGWEISSLTIPVQGGTVVVMKRQR